MDEARREREIRLQLAQQDLRALVDRLPPELGRAGITVIQAYKKLALKAHALLRKGGKVEAYEELIRSIRGLSPENPGWAAGVALKPSKPTVKV